MSKSHLTSAGVSLLMLLVEFHLMLQNEYHFRCYCYYRINITTRLLVMLSKNPPKNTSAAEKVSSYFNMLGDVR